MRLLTKSYLRNLIREELNQPDIYVVDERSVGKLKIIVMQDKKDSTMRSAIFKAGDENKFNRNKQEDILKLWNLAEKYGQKIIPSNVKEQKESNGWKTWGLAPDTDPIISNKEVIQKKIDDGTYKEKNVVYYYNTLNNVQRAKLKENYYEMGDKLYALEEIVLKLSKDAKLQETMAELIKAKNNFYKTLNKYPWD